MKERLEYLAYKCMSFVFGIMPFWLLYVFSDIMSFLIQYILRYRRKIVEENLYSAFPLKSKSEIIKLRKRFYRNLSDMLAEGLKGNYAKAHKIRDRIQITNANLLDEYYEKGQSCVVMMAHYANWEWILPFGASFFKHKWCAIYKPIRNKRIDKELLRNRIEHGLMLYSQQQTGFMIKNNIAKPALFVYISDQSPGGDVTDSVWTNFLNRQTALISGAEVIARKFNLPVFYLNIQRTSRGRYSGMLQQLELNPSTTERGDISVRYMKTLENIIIDKPEYWLWSHRRWKKSPPSSFLISE